jgi:hypothetical protein
MVVVMNSSTTLGQSHYVIKNEEYTDDMGYIIEDIDHRIYVTFWAFTEDSNKITEKRMSYNSLHHLYNESKVFITSSLINYSTLHRSKYRMMCDYIRYYETTNN